MVVNKKKNYRHIKNAACIIAYLPVFFSNSGHCYHYPAHRRFSPVPNLVRGNCFEMGRPNQLNSTVSN